MESCSCADLWELCDLEDSTEGRLVSEIAYKSLLVSGKPGRDPRVNYRYFKHQGTPEEIKKAKEELNNFYKEKVKFVGNLKKRIDKSNGQIKSLDGVFYFNEGAYPFTLVKN